MGLWDRLAAANAARRADWEWVKAERAARQAALSGRSGRLTMTRPTAPQPPQSPSASAQDYQPGDADPFPTLISPAVPVARSQRKWPWVVGGAVLLLLIVGVVNVGYHSSTPMVAASPPQEQALPVSAQVTLPVDLVGKNVWLADDELRNLGIVNIRYVSQDAEYKGVLFFEKWTVTKVAPAPGAVVSIEDTVVVTATRKAGSIPQQPASPLAPAALAPAGQQPAPAPASEERVEMPIEQTNMAPQQPAPQPVAPQPVEQPVEQPVKPQRGNDGSGGTVYYKNCGQARAAGAAPIKRAEPGYRAELDRDNDGIACEK